LDVRIHCKLTRHLTLLVRFRSKKVAVLNRWVMDSWPSHMYICLHMRQPFFILIGVVWRCRRHNSVTISLGAPVDGSMKCERRRKMLIGFIIHVENSLICQIAWRTSFTVVVRDDCIFVIIWLKGAVNLSYTAASYQWANSSTVYTGRLSCPSCASSHLYHHP